MDTFDLYKDIYDAQMNLLKSFNQGTEKNEKEKKGAKQRDDKDHRWFAPFLEIRVSP